MNMTMIQLLCIALCINSALGTYNYHLMTQNNTGPENRTRPTLTCFPALDNEQFPKCFVSGGITLDASSNIVAFYCDLWRMDIDLDTNSVAWTLIDDDLPQTACGGFHQFWRNNLTSFSVVGGVNGFSPTGLACDGDQIFTYDYLWDNYKVETPAGGSGWGDLVAGACGTLGDDDVYCFGGFSCSTFQDTNSWTKYSRKTGAYTQLASTNLDDLPARHHSSVTCYDTYNFCIIGSGDRLAGGTVDQWSHFFPSWDLIVNFNNDDTPQNIQYLSPDSAEVWRKKGANYKVVREHLRMLLVGGDNATGVSGASDTLRYVGVYDPILRQFEEQTATGLFSIKQEYLRSIPQWKDETKDITDYIEFAGPSSNDGNFEYPNEVVLHQIELNY